VKFHEFLTLAMCVDNTQLQAPSEFSSATLNSFSPATYNSALWGSFGKLEIRRTSKHFASWQEATPPLLRINLNHVACKYSYL